MGASTGAAYAVANPGVAGVKITQQNGACTGVVVDATGETVIGASVIVKGTTNGTITGLDGDFSLSNVKKRGYHSNFICRLSNSRDSLEWTTHECNFTR